MLACLPMCRTVSTSKQQVLLGVIPVDMEVRSMAFLYKFKG